MVLALAIAERNSAPAVQDVAVSDPGPRQVRIAVEAASVNGFDASVAAGSLWDMMPHEFPVVLGRDFAGTVEVVGRDVTEVGVGDRVVGGIKSPGLGDGAIAESVTTPADSLAIVPEGVTTAEAAALGLAAVTALDLVSGLAPTADDVVLIAGATGGVGAYAVQLAARAGSTVLATARPGEAADFVRDLGAHAVIDRTDDLSAGVTAAARRPLTAVIHAAGDPWALAELLPPGGRLVSALGATADQIGRTDLTITSVMAASEPHKFTTLLAMAAAGELRVPIMRTYPLDRAADAITDFADHKLGKLVVIR